MKFGGMRVATRQKMKMPRRFPMHIRLMKVFEYDSTGWNCQETSVRNPTLGEMQAAVRKLNKFEFPFVWFFGSEDVGDDATPELDIMGGDGDYVLSSFDGEGIHRQMKFLSHSDKRIDVWLSDQGASFDAKFICHDIQFVLDVLARYATTGKFPDDIIWE